MKRALLCLVLPVTVASVSAETAGGRWTHEALTDKLTDHKSDVFRISSQDSIGKAPHAGIPEFSIVCAGGKWSTSKMDVPTPPAVGLQNPFGELESWILLRADGKMHSHNWKIQADYTSMFVDKGATREMVRSSDVRVQFRDADGNSQVATFAPAGMDRAALRTACGAIFDK